jgi:hypothetical protein
MLHNSLSIGSQAASEALVVTSMGVAIIRCRCDAGPAVLA